MTEAERGWVAGILDGESCISIRYDKKHLGRYSLQVCVGNTCRPLCVRLQKLTGIGRIHKMIRPKPGHMQGYNWMVSRQQGAEHLLHLVLPLLVVKKSQARLALEFLEFVRQCQLANMDRTLTPEQKQRCARYKARLSALKKLPQRKEIARWPSGRIREEGKTDGDSQ